MSASHIVILNVEPKFNAHYIADFFWRKEIGKVSSITLLPKIDSGVLSSVAYVYFDSFCETEAAYEFIDAMKSDAYMISHNDSDPENNIWVLEKNTHHSGELCVGVYTTAFMPDYFESFTTGDPSFLGKITDLNCQHHIVGLDSHPYDVDEALSHLWLLNYKSLSTSKYEDFIDEIHHFELQIALHYISRGQGEPIMYDILKSLGVNLDERKIDVRRQVGMGCDEYKEMEKFIEYCKPRVDFMYEMQNPTNIQRQTAVGTEALDNIDLSLLSVNANADESLPPPPLPLFQRETGMTNEEIAALLRNN